MKKFCKDLREHPIKITNSAEKEMISLTTKENKSDQNQKVCHICKKSRDHKVRDHCRFTGKIEELLIIFSI